jgi:ABC-type multidrug transport system fused ATPase/permease subunit
MARIGNEITAENQCRPFDKMLCQDLAFFGESEFAALGASSVSSVLAVLITTIGRDVPTLGGLVFVVVVQSPGLSVIGLFVIAPAMLTVRHLIKRVRHLAQRDYGGSVLFLETLLETVQGLRVVKALGLEEEMRRSLHESNASVRQTANMLAMLMNQTTPIMESRAGTAVGLVLMYGGYCVIFQIVAPGRFITLIAAFLLAYEPAKRLARLNVDLSGALVGVRVLLEIIDLPDRVEESEKPEVNVRRGRVELHDVNFAYRPNESVLRGLSLTAEPGQTTALVRPSGGGKSTIFNLLLHFYEAQGGDITIDGQNIAQVSAKSLREQIAYLGQDISVFRASIRKNIVFGRIDASEQDIVAAAHAHEFISRFLADYDVAYRMYTVAHADMIYVVENGIVVESGRHEALLRLSNRYANFCYLQFSKNMTAENARVRQSSIAGSCRASFASCRAPTTLAGCHRLFEFCPGKSRRRREE